jgi:HEAT repeat protein
VTTVHTTDEFIAWIEELAISHRAKRAFWHLVISGPDASPATRRGLAHKNPQVRDYCARVLDHLADERAFDDLLALLDDPCPQVRRDALHALACDRRKDNVFRPDKSVVLPKATKLLLGDPNKHVRAGAAEVVARWVHTDPEAEAALLTARDRDPDPSVRKKAGWYAAEGPIHRKTRPKLDRT